MKYLALFLLLLTLASAFIDSDFDGVGDENDKCPNSQFTDLVNSTGCTIKSLVKAHKFDVVMGVSFSQLDKNTFNVSDTIYKTYQIGYRYKDFTALASTSTYKNDEDNGFNDTSLGLYYHFNGENNFSFISGIEVILPTYETNLDNEATDYSASVELVYLFEKFSLFNKIKYTFINDSNVDGITYQDTVDNSTGVGYYILPSLYSSVSYNYSNSIYQGVEALKNGSIYLYYELDKDFFVTGDYAYGLSDSESDNFISISLGYNF